MYKFIALLLAVPFIILFIGCDFVKQSANDAKEVYKAGKTILTESYENGREEVRSTTKKAQATIDKVRQTYNDIVSASKKINEAGKAVKDIGK